MTTSPGRLAYLAKRTDTELHRDLANNELLLLRTTKGKGARDLEADRKELLAEMLRRPNFAPTKAGAR